MKPAFSATATIETTVQPYDQYYNPSASSPPSHHDTSPRHHQSYPQEHHYTSYPQQHHRSSYPSHPSQPYSHPHSQHPQLHSPPHQPYSPRSSQQHPHDTQEQHHSVQRSHSPYQSHYPSHAQRSPLPYPQYNYNPTHSPKHTEGYEGRVRNTNRDHNDHLLTDRATADQQQHHDQFRRDNTYGFLKHHPAEPAYLQSGEDPVPIKYNLPPILAPEEPFYRMDLPGRHMRYFSKVTSQDREDRHGYYSSARHVAPSNTSGNFGHGPPIGAALDRYGRQQQQQQHPPSGPRLPSLYTALPDQRPVPAPSPSSSSSSSSSSSAAPPHARSESDNSLSPQSALPSHHSQHHARSPVPPHAEKASRHPPAYAPQPQHMSAPASIKPKAIQPRSIAPAPLVSGPPSSSETQAQSSTSPRAAGKRTDRQIKAEPRDAYNQRLAQDGSSAPQAMVTKRKWSLDHAPSRSAGMDASQEDSSAQELHLLSRRGHAGHSHHESTLPKKMHHQRTRMQRYQMMTIRCWHGAIAQKSYGIEKRYLCPPPMVQVSAGVNAKQVKAEQPHVTMSVIHEKVNGHQGENLMEQDCSLDDALKTSFRNLHVTGTGSDSSKRFKLGLQVYLNKSSSLPTAVMDSNPIPIISKPSKKTAKAGNASCFILNGMSVSLLNRINAQTVRTKYMAVDNNAVCAKIGSWSSFTIKMVKPPPTPSVKAVSANVGAYRAPAHSTKFVPIRMKGESGPAPSSVPMARNHSQSNNGPSSNAPSLTFQQQHQQSFPYRPSPQQEPVHVFSNSEPVLYGAEIVLINDMTGIMTDRLIIRKVENGKVSRSGTGPVSQMQKVVLEHPDRVHSEDGRPYYLSASSFGSPKIEGKIPLQAAMDRSPLLEYRTSSKKASIMDLTDAQEDEEDELCDEEGSFNSMPKRVGGKTQDLVAVDDFVCWTIAGIAKFDYTYFGPIPASIDTDVDPSKVPTVLSRPMYNPHSNSITMKVSNVFEKLNAEEEARLAKHQEDPYERRLTLSEYVYKRCEDTRQPMHDEEGPVQLWLAQHGPIRMRRRKVQEILPGEDEVQEKEEDEESDSDEQETDSTEADQEAKTHTMSDQLPKIATKAQSTGPTGNSSGNGPQASKANGRYFGGSHLPPNLASGATQKPRKMAKGPMGLEAELPYGCEVRVAHDAHGNAKAELDILMVERASGVAYRTGYRVVYSRDRERSDWNVEVVG